MDNRLDLHIFIHGQDQTGVMQTLAQIQKTLGELKMDDAQVKALLDNIDVTTTKIGNNLDVVAVAQSAESSIVQTISDELTALVAKEQPAGGISAANGAQLSNLAMRLQQSSDNSDKITAVITAQVPVLQGIAAAGAPVVPPPPPPVDLPPSDGSGAPPPPPPPPAPQG